ncbi:MAG: HdeD family acid-resistance protein [Cyanobium sp.]
MPSGATFNAPDEGEFAAVESALTRQALQAGRLKGLTQAEGIVMIVLGLLALLFPVIASAGVTVMVAVAFLVAGLMGWIDTFSRGRRLTRWHGLLRLIVASLFLYAGLWMLLQFKAGVVPAATQIKALATAVGLVFLFEGVVMSILALAHRRATGWGWGLVNGVVTFVLGLLILTMSPAGLLSVLGLLVGISFLFSGFDLLGFSARLHNPTSIPPGSPTASSSVP